MKTYRDFKIIQNEGSDRFDLYREVTILSVNKDTNVKEPKMIEKLIGYSLTEKRVLELISGIIANEKSEESFISYLKEKAKFYNEIVEEMSK